MVTRSPYPTRGGNQGQRRPRLPRVVVGAALAHRGHDVSGSLTEAELTLINMDDIAAASRDGMSRERPACIYEARRDPGGQHIAEALPKTREGSR